MSGTVQYLQVEGGCWRLLGRDGTSYELRRDQAPAALLVDGAGATVVARVRTDLMSICMVGVIVDIVRVESLRVP